MPDPMTDERLAEIRGYIDAGVADIDVVDLFAEVERLRKAVRAWSNAHADALDGWEEAKSEVERLRKELAETTHVLAVTGEKADALRGQRDRAEAERDQARAELTEIRQHDETSGGVLYDVIGRAIVRALTPDEAVRAIERRLIQPLVAQRQEARAKARRGRRPDAAVAQAVAQRDAVAVAAEKEWEKHGEEIAGYERAVAELVAERDDYRSRLVATDKAYTEQATRADTAEAERDAAREQVERIRLCWKSARRGRAMARAELATWQAAGRTTDLEGDVGDHLSDLADWETENATAPEWLVKAVVDLLAPIAAERDRLTRERDGLARADKAGQRWASGRIDALEEKVHRVRQVHAPQCGGGCAAVSCECGPDDLVCAECETPVPCATIRALGGAEPGQ